MKLTVLVDNKCQQNKCLISEHGLSFLIEDGRTNLLFDCGSTDAFIKNSYDLQIDLSKVTDVILSHGHTDHIGGFPRLQALYEQFRKSGINFNTKKLLAHPNVFRKENPEKFEKTPFPLKNDDFDEFFKIILTVEPQYITSKLVYLGEIPIKYGKVLRDYAPDETALAYKSKKGLIIFSGCSHSGVKNIAEHAKDITGEKKINTIIGGLYLINRTEDEINELGEYLKEQRIEHIYPCHCTDIEAKAILSNYVKIEEIATGSRFDFD